MNITSISKALLGGATAALTALVTAAADGHVTGPEWLGIAFATLAVFGGVYGVPNGAAAPLAVTVTDVTPSLALSADVPAFPPAPTPPTPGPPPLAAPPVV
jgi:hypothetical protein